MSATSVLPPEEQQHSQNAYKYVKFFTPIDIKNEDSNAKLREKNYPYKSLKPCISFNTVPITNANSKKIDKIYTSDFRGVQFPTDYTMEEYYDNESGYISDNPEYMLHNQYLLNNLTSNDTKRRSGSPQRTVRHSSPTRAFNNSNKIRSHKAIELTDMFKISKNGKIVREDYPTRPTIQNNSMVINNSSQDWDKLWALKRSQIDNRLLNKSQFFKYDDILFTEKKMNTYITNSMASDGFTPLTKNQKRKIKILSERVGYPNLPRTILCYIDGRKHTWVGLDWVITNFIADTDHLIVVTSLPSLTGKRKQNKYHKHGKSQTRNGRTRTRPSLNRMSSSMTVSDLESSDSDTSDDESESLWYPGYDFNVLKDKMHRIRTYIESILLINKPEKEIKLTIEATVGKTINCLCDMTNIYMPDLIVLSNLNIDTCVNWKTKSDYVSDKICTSFPIPVIVVPALYMTNFEKKLESKSKELKRTTQRNNNPTIKILNDNPIDTLDKLVVRSLKESIKANKMTSHGKKKSMLDVADFKAPKKKSTQKHIPATLSSTSSDLKLRKIKSVDPSRLQTAKSSYYAKDTSSKSKTSRRRSNSPTEGASLRSIKSNTDVVRKHTSSSSSSNSLSNKGFFSSIFKGSSPVSPNEKPQKEKKKGLFGW